MNSALNLLRAIGGTADIIADAGWTPMRKAKPEPREEPRILQPLRSYHKRYRNNIAEYIRRINADKAHALRTALNG